MVLMHFGTKTKVFVLVVVSLFLTATKHSTVNPSCTQFASVQHQTPNVWKQDLQKACISILMGNAMFYQF